MSKYFRFVLIVPLLVPMCFIHIKSYAFHLESVIANDTNRSSQWGLDKININDGWTISTGSNTVKVGIIDSGVDASHQELSINSTLSKGYITGYTNPGVDNIGHGTNVAGIIGAATNNQNGMSGICWNVDLISLRVVCDANGNFDNWAIRSAIIYAKNNGIDILNMSFGNSSSNLLIKNAISNYSGLIVASAGNDTRDNDTNPHYPSGYPYNNIISVGSSDSSDAISNFSNFGQTTVDLFAPGSSIYTTDKVPSNYRYAHGTSFAAPHVTAVAALIKSTNPSLSAIQIKNIILNNVDAIPSMTNKCVSGGRLNAYSSLLAAIPSVTLSSNQHITPLKNMSTNDYQWYKIVVNSTSNYEFYDNSGVNIQASLYQDIQSNPLITKTTSSAFGDMSLTHTLQANNTYYLKVINLGSGNYDIYASNHSHNDLHGYIWANGNQHRVYCSCGNSTLEPHVVTVDDRNTCILCGGHVDLGVIRNNLSPIWNDSFLSENKIIMLGKNDYAIFIRSNCNLKIFRQLVEEP